MFRSVALAGVIALALGPTSRPADQSRRVDLEAGDCSSVNVQFGDYETARATQRGSAPVGGSPLEIRPDTNGGVRVERGAGRNYDITACIAAGARSPADAQAAADSVGLVVEGNRVRVTGVGGGRGPNLSRPLVLPAPERGAAHCATG